MNISTICVCGAGTMGSGIAQVAAAAGFSTILFDVNGTVLEKARASISKNLEFLVSKNKLKAEEKDQIFSRIRFSGVINECAADLVIEAIIEKPEAKTELFQQLEKVNGSETIFTSNTSSLSVTSLAKQMKHPELFAGLHFFNPAPLMKLVEVVKTDITDKTVIDTLVSMAKTMGKIPVVCTDAPGFIVNRVARPFYIESLRLLESGVADIETIDRLLNDRGFKMGPFQLMDLIGNDINYAVSCSVYEQLGKPERLRPSGIQKEKVESGELGKKTNKGYYSY